MNPSKNKVFVIEDDPTIQLCLQILLENEGYIVLQALNGQLALDKLSAVDSKDFPDLVLLDLMLPDVSGEDLLAGILSSERLTALPVIIMSAAVDASRIAKKFKRLLIKKPFEPDALLEVVEKYCK